MKNVFILILICLTSCVTHNPNKAKRKMTRLAEANPSVVETDSVDLEELLDVPGQNTTAEVNVNDSTLDRDVEDKFSSESTDVQDKIKSALKSGVKSGNFQQGKTTIKITDKGKGIRKIETSKPHEQIKVKKRGTIKFVKVPVLKKDRTWYQKTGDWIKNKFMWLGIIFLLLFLFWLYRKFF